MRKLEEVVWEEDLKLFFLRRGVPFLERNFGEAGDIKILTTE